ncbi:hypothetical protein DCS_01039 [Drechmeria coniospora]|uniref:Uncharacterized protein n=1 Tax=Drechmeria coniospora TaxID=98403 RepID=A0A151GS30_DRECN|nr:hypothetical protein DCS_01039 [Drechmeria coniospora]KYK59905.1 hypothetical protein DCS_01039 [Drechmeria coniospora]
MAPPEASSWRLLGRADPARRPPPLPTLPSTPTLPLAPEIPSALPRGRNPRGLERQPDARPRPKTASNLSATEGSFSSGNMEGAMLLKSSIGSRRTREEVASLVDFLKNHPPPPGNFMSIPYGGGAEDEHDDRSRLAKKFRKLRVGRRSKSMPRAPKNLPLPDSAVSGTTIGGHRHIAITIPMEAVPIADHAPAQPPIRPPPGGPAAPARKGTVRTFVNEKGVVTVLRPVTEVSEPPSTAPSRSGSPHSAIHRRSRMAPLSIQQPLGGAGGGKPYDYIGILPTPLDTPLLDDGSAPWNRSASPDDSPGSGPGHGRQDSLTFERSSYPARGSSMKASRNVTPVSIDGLLSQQKSWSNSTHRRSGRSCSGSSESQEARPRVPTENAQRSPSRCTKLALAVDNGNSSTGTGEDCQCQARIIIPEKPVVSARDDSRPTTPASSKSRKDAVRDRKRRDLEVMQGAKQTKERGRESGSQGDEAESDGESPRRRAQPGDGGDARQQQLTLSCPMVVVDVEPCPSPRESQPRTATMRFSAEALPWMGDPNIPSPPISSNGSPPPTFCASALDRASFTRRREWKAIFEHERRAREALALASALFDESSGSQADRGATRAEHLRDMERRVRHFERNGDVWLRALAPVFDEQDGCLVAASSIPLDCSYGRDWVSDDEASTTTERTRRGPRRAAGRRSLSHGRLVIELAADERESGDDASSDDVGGSNDTNRLPAMELPTTPRSSPGVGWPRTVQVRPSIGIGAM